MITTGDDKLDAILELTAEIKCLRTEMKQVNETLLSIKDNREL